MARPSKSVKTMSKNLKKEEYEQRLSQEKALMGRGASVLIPPTYLNKKQKALFKFIVMELENANILCGLDTYILETCVIAIDRLQYIEHMINKDTDQLFNKDLLSAKDKYTKDLYRCCNELSLSPQARAKLAHVNVQTERDKQDPVLKLLSGGVL